MPLFFWFDLFLEARAEIPKYYRSYFGANENFKKVLSELTDLYLSGKYVFGWETQQVQVVLSFVRYCKKTFHQNRLFSQFGMDIFEVRRELNTMFPELF